MKISSSKYFVFIIVSISLISFTTMAAVAEEIKITQHDEFILKRREQQAKQGNAQAQFELGLIYMDGAMRPKNCKKAKELFQQSADHNNPIAQLYLANMYKEGCGNNENNCCINKDYSKALYYYKQSSKQGNGPASFFLGLMYFEGENIKKDYTKARYYWQKAANKKFYTAYFYLGKLYEKGESVPQNYEKAIKLYEIAANNHVEAAQYRLAQLYETGIGVPKDTEKANYWYKKDSKPQR